MKIYLVIELSPLNGLSRILRSGRRNMVGLDTKVFFLFRICMFLSINIM